MNVRLQWSQVYTIMCYKFFAAKEKLVKGLLKCSASLDLRVDMLESFALLALRGSLTCVFDTREVKKSAAEQCALLRVYFTRVKFRAAEMQRFVLYNYAF